MGNLHIVIYADLIHTQLERTLRCVQLSVYAEEYNDFRGNRFMYEIKDFTCGYVSFSFNLFFF